MMRVAFLIEGFTSATHQFEEVLAGQALAKANGSKLFDPIESYSIKHLSAVLKKLPQQEWPYWP